MARFSISGYDNDSKCKVCGAHVSEIHYEGCEISAIRTEIMEMRLVIKQFLKLLGVKTITSAFAKIAAEHSVQSDFCPRCGGSKVIQANFTWVDCPNCVTGKSR